MQALGYLIAVAALGLVAGVIVMFTSRNTGS
jgi:hypothetical protein